MGLTPETSAEREAAALIAVADDPLPSDQAAELAARIVAYCRRVKLAESAFGVLALDHPGFVGMLRKRSMARGRSATVAQSFMDRFPAGVDAQQWSELAARTRAVMTAYRAMREAYAAPKRSAFNKPQREQLREAVVARRERIEPGFVAPPPIPARDPCFRCGTRRDVGCRHYPKEGQAFR